MRKLLKRFFPDPEPTLPPFFEKLQKRTRPPFGRGEGRTAYQLLKLAEGGVYLVRDEQQRSYVRELMRILERTDIEVMTIARAEYGHHLRGRTIPDYDIDHYLLESMYSQMMGNVIRKARENLDMALKRG